LNIKQINHIGIVVQDLEAAKRQFGKGLGLEFLREESAEDFHCRIAFYQCGEVMIELVMPTGPGPSNKFLETYGEGIHHICYEVEDINEALKDAKKLFRTGYDAPKAGAGDSRIFFLDAESICSVETEFVELKK